MGPINNLYFDQWSLVKNTEPGPYENLRQFDYLKIAVRRLYETFYGLLVAIYH